MIPMVLALTAALFAVWFCSVWICAELPRVGTLEWIFDFERPRFSVKPAYRFTLGDLFWWLIPAAVGAMAVAAGVLFTETAVTPTRLVLTILPSSAAAIAVYFLAKSLTDCVLPSLAAGCLTAFSTLLISEETALVAVAILAAWMWFSGDAWWKFALSGVSLAVATVFDPQLAAFGAVLLLIVLIGVRQRVIADQIGVFGAVLTVFLPFAAFAVTIPLAFTPAALSLGMGFPQCYGRADFWGMITGYYAESLPIMLFGGVHPWSFFYAMLQNLPCVALTACGLIVPLVQFLRRKSGAALFVWLWCLAVAVLYVFGTDCTVITGAMVLAYGSTRLLRRGHAVCAAFAMALALLAEAATAVSVVLIYLSII